MNVEMKPDMMILRQQRLMRLPNEARVLEIQAKNVALGKKVKDPAATKVVKDREASYYRVTCKLVEDYSSLKDFNYYTLFLIYDNGRGMPHDDTLNMFGR
ncbi:hypothetical protein H5410_063948, partial [Solanum commersonii]